MLDALRTLKEHYAALFKKASIDFDNLGTLFRLGSLLEDEQKVYDLIKLNAKLSGNDGGLLGIDEPLRELYRIQQRITEHQNDLRLKNLLQHGGDAERIKARVSGGKRLTTDYARLLLSSFACIIAEPEALFRYFPMEEDLIDILIFDEASQVSIAHSISLILRAKQVVVFGDEYQYGAVGAVTVSRKYAQGYFRKILDSYKAEFHGQATPEQEEKIIAAEADETPEEDQFIPGEIPVDAGPEWIRTFGIRNSTLNFCRAISNYRTTLTEHFRSFKEIIDYSNKYFYEVAQYTLDREPPPDEAHYRSTALYPCGNQGTVREARQSGRTGSDPPRFGEAHRTGIQGNHRGHHVVSTNSSSGRRNTSGNT